MALNAMMATKRALRLERVTRRRPAVFMTLRLISCSTFERKGMLSAVPHRNNLDVRTLTSKAYNGAAEQLRIAIVGGGVGGLSAALHLSRLVAEGKIASPIDVYPGPPSGAAGRREVGVGIWSTALQPFQTSNRSSHAFVWHNISKAGRWVGEVGYRSPSGAWLAKSELGDGAATTENGMPQLPSLLFLRECDLLESLQKGVAMEKDTIRVHENKLVHGIKEDYTQLYSAPLMLVDEESSSKEATKRDYHFIVCADGLNSIMRKRYGGHRRITDSTALGGNSSSSGSNNHSASDSLGELALEAHPNYDSSSHLEANAVEDRGYTVFRGNADLSIQETGMDGASFQTWGEGDSMRFATVPLSYYDGKEEERRKEKQVWFATSSLSSVLKEQDPALRKQRLLASFSNWHDPICRLIEATPADEIIMDRAVAHRHWAGPVRDVRGILTDVYNAPPPSSMAGPGPALGFLGDAFMTVDPILAQGYTLAMESGYELAASVEASCVVVDDDDAHDEQHASKNNSGPTKFRFEPKRLRRTCQWRNDQRSNRIVHMLRATDMVQALGQPKGGGIGSLCRYVIRPAMQVTPDFIKTPVFNAMLNYSLGIPIRRRTNDDNSTE